MPNYQCTHCGHLNSWDIGDPFLSTVEAFCDMCGRSSNQRYRDGNLICRCDRCIKDRVQQRTIKIYDELVSKGYENFCTTFRMMGEVDSPLPCIDSTDYMADAFGLIEAEDKRVDIIFAQPKTVGAFLESDKTNNGLLWGALITATDRVPSNIMLFLSTEERIAATVEFNMTVYKCTLCNHINLKEKEKVILSSRNAVCSGCKTLALMEYQQNVNSAFACTCAKCNEERAPKVRKLFNRYTALTGRY